MKKIPKIDIRSTRERLCDLLFRPGSMPSSERRVALLSAMVAWENEHPDGVLVNAHHCANLHKDKDLRVLVKQSKLSVHRVHTGKFRHARFAETYLRVVR